MKNEIINRFCGTLQRNGIEADWNDITNELVVILDDYDIKPAERALVVRDETINETLFQKFLIGKAVAGCSKRTLEQYKSSIRRFLDKVQKNIPDITTDDIRLYLALRQTRDKISKSYADTELRYLRSLFNYLTVEELIPKNPTAKITKIKSEKKQKKAFSDIEIEQIRGACQNNRERAIVELLLSTGCRVSELVQIRLDDINNDEVLVHGKGNKERIVYLNAKALYVLREYLKERKDNNPYLFPKGIWNSTRKIRADWYKHPECIQEGHNDTGTIEQFARKVGKKVGILNCHPHRFRRTCATMALSRGMSLVQVSKMLGHENLATTEIYLDIHQEEIAAAHKKYVV